MLTLLSLPLLLGISLALVLPLRLPLPLLLGLALGLPLPLLLGIPLGLALHHVLGLRGLPALLGRLLLRLELLPRIAILRLHRLGCLLLYDSTGLLRLERLLLRLSLPLLLGLLIARGQG